VYIESNSSGDTLKEIVTQLIAIHRDASVLAPPDPLELAAELYQRETTDQYGLWRDTTETYSRALGETGKREFRRLLLADWEKLPALTKEVGRHSRYDPRRSRITSMMESLAEREKDTDLALSILQRDLSDSGRYSLVVQTLLKTGRRDDARSWAERALKEFGADTNRYLTDFLVGEYRSRGEHGRALRILWSRFENSPAVETYQSLREYTEPLGEWGKWRGDALLLLRKRIAEKPSVPSHRQSFFAANSLIDIYLWEENTDAAWETAQAHGTDDEHWKQVATKREATHPNEALATWRKLFDKEMNRASGYYNDVIWLLTQLQRVYRTLGREADFAALVADLRVKHKNKRKFVSELNARVG
jgi:tetratricopeptide (TPR) repeat protein